jgi:hypothetical protein
MPKKAYKIEDFSGGINQLADPRDIQDNQFEELFNADVSRIGRITLPGNALEPYQTTNVKNTVVSPNNTNEFSILNTNQGLTPGYGLFAFSHDFNMRGITGSANKEQSTDFLCINDGAHIDIWDSCHISALGMPFWINSAIKLGEAHTNSNESKIKPTYYMAGSGLRACDGSFNELKSGATLGTGHSNSTTELMVQNANGVNVPTYFKVDNEIVKAISLSGDSSQITVKRGQFGTKKTSHASGTELIYVNVPKVLTHVNRPMLEDSGANVNINRWVEDIQAPEKPDPGALTLIPDGKLLYNNGTNLITGAETLLPSGPETVHLGLFEAADGDDIFRFHNSTVPSFESGNSGESIVVIATQETDVAEKGFAIGKAVIISGCTGDGVVLNGVHEIVGLGTGGVFKIACESPVSFNANHYLLAEIQLEKEVISDDLKNQYILGMSYLYQGGGNEIQESDVTTAHLLTKYISESESVFRTTSNWITADSSFVFDGSEFSTSESDGWLMDDGIAKTNNGNDEWLVYKVSSGGLTAGGDGAREYYVSVTIDSYTDGTLDVYLAPDAAFTTTSKLSINPASTGLGTYIAKLTTQTDGTGTNVIGIQAKSNASLGISNVQVWSTTGTEMTATNAMDFRTYLHAIKGQFGFLCNNSRSGTTQNNSWNERIEGFKIYMKQVDMIGGGLAEDFLLLYEVDLKDGTYICHGKDGDKETLRLGDISSNEWSETYSSGDSATVIDQKSIVTSNLAGDSIKSIPLLSYESENGYPAGTNLAAMYKTSATIQRKVYIGNLKIGNRTYPDRMMRADADKFDTFPDDGTHFIDVATADGDSIVKLESFGDKLIQYKEKTSFLIKVTSEGEELLETWQGAGVLSPSQVVKTNKGVVWVNSNGLYLYDGEKLSQVSEDRFKSEEWSINENKETPVILGYHENSNKVIIQTLNNTATNSGGFIYDLSTGAIIQCQKLFKWYISQSVDDLDVDTVTGNPKVSPPLIVTDGEGPLA